MMKPILKIGSKGNDVKILQNLLNSHLGVKLLVDGDFGAKTESSVKFFQKIHLIEDNGIVDDKCWDLLYRFGDTDLNKTTNFETYYLSEGRFILNPVTKKQEWLPNYWNNQTRPEWVFLHHTAGGPNPYQTIDIWDKDSKTVGTKFVVGGVDVNGDDKYNGKILDCLKKGCWSAHLTIGATKVHRESIGIEICNYGSLTKGGYYVYNDNLKKNVWVYKNSEKYYNAYGNEIPEEYVCDLGWDYRFGRYSHKYTLKQIESVRELLLNIQSSESGIDVTRGLKTLIQKQGVQTAFGFFPDYIERNPGLYAHGNIFIGKNDVIPQPEMVEMILSL